MPLDLDAPELHEIDAFSMPAAEFPEEDLDEEGIHSQAEEDAEHAEHYANLADEIPDEDLRSLANQVIEDLRTDTDSCMERDEMLAEGMRFLGIDRQSDSKTEPFPGCASLTDPALMQSVVDIHARLMRELMPAKGPVNTQIIGRETPQKRDRAKRLKVHMNWQTEIQMPEFRPTMDLAMMVLPVTGSVIKKVFWDSAMNRPRAEFLSPSDFVVPYHSKDLETAPRMTEIMHMTGAEIMRVQASGFWRDIPLGEPTQSTMENQGQVVEVTDQVQGISNPMTTQNTPFKVYESHRELDIGSLKALEDDPPAYPLPYIVTVHEATGQVLAIRRNWREGDPQYRRRLWYVHYKFMPWLGFYGIGLVHLIGGLARAATGASRALLDAAMSRTISGGFRLKGGRVSGETIMAKPMQYVPLEAPPGVRDIKQIVMPYPTNPPDPGLMQMLEFVTARAEKFASIATQAITDANPQGAVGTTLALIEQDSIVYSGIHQRQHATFGQELRMLAELNGEYLDDQVVVKTFGGEAVVSRMDYLADVDVIPVSDPSVFSQAQRAAKANAKWELAKAAKAQGIITDLRAAAVEVADTLGMDDPDVLFPPPQQAQPLDPVSEFAAIVAGQPVKAFPGQDHQAHVGFLMAKGQDPINQPIMPVIGPALQALVADHLVAQQREEIMAMLQQQFQGQPVPPQVVEQAMAQAANMVAQQRQHQAMMAAQQAQGQPDDALAKVAMMDVQRKAADDQAKAQLAQQRLQAEQAQAGLKAQLDQAKIAAEAQRAQMQSQLDAAKLQIQQLKDRQAAEMDAARIAAEDARARAAEQTKAGIAAAQIASREKVEAAKLAADLQMQREENASDVQIASQVGTDPKIST